MSTLKFFLVLSFTTFLFSNVSLAKVSIQIGGDENMDVCPSLARVVNLSKGPDGFLAVKNAPNLKAVRVDKIYNGQNVFICQESADGKWYGIVYSNVQKLECGVTSPIEKKKEYDGPCKSGWVSKKYIKIFAG